VATGLRDSYDFDWNPRDKTLYIIDNERANQPAEINAVTRPGLDFGWPRCDAKAQPIPGIAGATAAYCAKTSAPVVTFEPGSHPMGMAFYRSDLFTQLKDSLVVALAGSWNAPTTAGYELDAVPFDAQGKPEQPQRFLPTTPRNTSDAALLRMSFYPFHLAGLVISPEGWIYTSVTEGRFTDFGRLTLLVKTVVILDTVARASARRCRGRSWVNRCRVSLLEQDSIRHSHYTL